MCFESITQRQQLKCYARFTREKTLSQYWLIQNFLTACLTRSYSFRVKMVPVCLEVGRGCFVLVLDLALYG